MRGCKLSLMNSSNSSLSEVFKKLSEFSSIFGYNSFHSETTSSSSDATDLIFSSNTWRSFLKPLIVFGGDLSWKKSVSSCSLIWFGIVSIKFCKSEVMLCQDLRLVFCSSPIFPPSKSYWISGFLLVLKIFNFLISKPGNFSLIKSLSF